MEKASDFIITHEVGTYDGIIWPDCPVLYYGPKEGVALGVRVKRESMGTVYYGLFENGRFVRG